MKKNQGAYEMINAKDFEKLVRLCIYYMYNLNKSQITKTGILAYIKVDKNIIINDLSKNSLDSILKKLKRKKIIIIKNKKIIIPEISRKELLAELTNKPINVFTKKTLPEIKSEIYKKIGLMCSCKYGIHMCEPCSFIHNTKIFKLLYVYL